MTAPQRPPLQVFSAYLAMLALALGAFLGIRAYGETLVPSHHVEAAANAATRPPSHLLFHVLLAVLVVVVASRALGAAFRSLRQPPVIGEVIAGIVLGPSLLGALAPGPQAFLFPSSITPHLGVVSQVGVILFMFLVGLELDTRALRERSHTTLAISHASIVLPFLLGSLLALWLYPRLSSASVGFTSFALFMGVSLSVTAFPVLARILSDNGMQRSRLGTIALACAAVDDVTAWCLLAGVVGFVQSSASSAFYTLGLTVGYVLVMLTLVRPVLKRWVEREEVVGRLKQSSTALILTLLLGSALITEGIGIHSLFGAFLLGAIIPDDSQLAREMKRSLEDLVVVLLLPAFFAYTGLRMQLGLLGTTAAWLQCGAIIAVACLGKFGGSALAARFSGLGWRDAASLGILMNTRGLMELIVLNVGLDLGVISPTLFAMLVIMAVVTTLATSPLLLLLHQKPLGRGVLGSAR